MAEAARPNKKALLVPQSLVDKVNAARPLCIFYKRPGGCKKGASCPQRHETTPPQQEAHMPYMSFAYAKDGNLKCTIRPPMDEAWDHIFKDSWRKVFHDVSCVTPFP